MQVSEMQRAGKGDNNIHRSVVLTLFQHSVKFLSLLLICLESVLNTSLQTWGT